MRLMKRPEAYWVLFSIIQKRIHPESLIRPGLLHPLYGLPDPHTDYKYPEQSANERYWGNWLKEFHEIDTSIERLHQALVYLTHYPGGRVFPFQRLSEAEWMRYHIEVYLQEMYIIDQRLSRFLRKVEKIAKAAGDNAGLSMIQQLKQKIRDGFSHV